MIDDDAFVRVFEQARLWSYKPCGACAFSQEAAARREKPPRKHVLLVEGFLLLTSARVLAALDLLVLLDISRDECRRRRMVRVHLCAHMC